ncbi:tissue factor pathway inhibitor [Mytilus galloprovincialis]|uniref:Tissue factor pathway inhibitor n=2 Tax=Mytilus galloprovincialis TaxID=29158 RepID=A0A8B6GFR9_MYTGA|nr:tissue factor pathway inhibitor [Mytilus galloprovincialis]
MYYKMKTLFIAICIFCVTMVTLVYGSTTPVATKDPHHNDCMLPTVPGMCKGYFPRYSFRAKTNTCEMFAYGGCGGNANNFLDIKECQIACIPV